MRHPTLLCLLALTAACSLQDPPADPADPSAGGAPGTAAESAAGSQVPAADPAGDAATLRAESAAGLSRQAATADMTYGGAAALPFAPAPHPALPPTIQERYPQADSNPVRIAAEHPVSTFSVDVDTASYSNVRRFLSQGALPPRDAVRIEELINYFSYDYPAPDDGAAFRVVAEAGPAPWHPKRRLLHIGIQGARLEAGQLPPANLVFLVDVSGSMHSPDKLDLLKASLKLLTRHLDADDRISLAVYAGAAGAVLEPTPGDQGNVIDAAIDRLNAGGSTNGGAGIQLAYAMARQAFIEDGINRVILATDGDFNVGSTDPRALEDLVTRQRDSGIALSVLGFGSGNYNDALMQRLAQSGNGNAAYVDTLNEGRKVLVDELASTLSIIASDVKVQVEFNPAVVDEYRLLGYETRLLDRADFNDDTVDAGDIGPGHSVTALYELTLRGSGAGQIDPLRYRRDTAAAPQAAGGHPDELAFVRLRHKPAGGGSSVLLEMPVAVADIHPNLAATSDAYRFASAVAGFGALLRGDVAGFPADPSTGARSFSYDDVAALAQGARGADPAGYRGEFLGLLRTADALTAPRKVAAN